MSRKTVPPRARRFALLVLLAAACSARNAAPSRDAAAGAAAGAPASASPLSTPAPPEERATSARVELLSAKSRSTAEPASPPDETGAGGAAPAFAASATDTASSTAAAAMLIRTGTASVEVDSVEQAVARLRDLATRLGGYVANASLAAGTDQVRSATLEIKVPSTRFDALTSGLRPLGHVETVDVKAEDVGEEYVDVAAQLANGRRLETRLVALAERQSNRLSDLLSVERELARVRGEIDRAEGRLRYLRAHAATSTLTVTVHAHAPLVGDSPSANPVVEAFRQAWRIFVGVVAFLIASLGVLVPLAIVAAIVLYARRRWGILRPRARHGERVAVSADDRAPASPPNPPRNV